MPDPNVILKAIREQRDLSVRQLAEKAGVNPATVSRIETGRRNGSLTVLAQIARALDVEPELIGGLSLDGAA